MERTGSRNEVCKYCPYARFEYPVGCDSDNYITCDPPMGECRLEFDAQQAEDYSIAKP